MKNASGDGSRLGRLDAIRGIAVLLVVAEHFPVLYLPFQSVLTDEANVGRAGVVAFFIVSGFVIPMSLDRQPNLGTFWLHRAFRLLPMYWVSLLAATVAMFCMPSITHSYPYCKEFPRSFLANFAMLEDFLKVPRALGLYWSLTFELVFYVAASGFSRIKQFPISEFILGGIVVFYAGFDLGALPIRSSSLLHFFVLIGTFLVGNVLYNQWSGKLENRWFLALSIGFGTTATLAWLKDAYGFHGTGSAEGLATVPFLVGALIGYATFFLVWSQPDSRFPKWLLWTGKVSYSIYLLHGVLLLAQPILGPWGTALLLVVGIPLLGWLGFNKVEQPFIAYSRKLRPRREPAVAVRQAS